MKKINVVFLIITITSILFSGCKEKTSKSVEVAEKEELVECLKLEKTKIAREQNFSTVLQGYETLNVSPSMQGKIEKIYVDVGSRVAKGDNLICMDQNQLNTLKLNFATLQVEMDRVKSLLDAGSISKQVYDQTKLQYDQTKHNMEFIEKNTFVKSEISGVVSNRNYENGELFTGIPILVITQVNMLKAMINVPESFFPLIKQGMKVEIISDIYKDQVFNATIEMIAPTVDPITHTFQVKLKVPNNKELLRPGMYIKANIEMGEVSTLIIPYQAVLKLQGSNERYIFLNENGIAKRVTVKLGQRFDDKIEIISNEIEEGKEIVVVGQARLKDGAKLKIQ